MPISSSSLHGPGSPPPAEQPSQSPFWVSLFDQSTVLSDFDSQKSDVCAFVFPQSDKLEEKQAAENGASTSHLIIQKPRQARKTLLPIQGARLNALVLAVQQDFILRILNHLGLKERATSSPKPEVKFEDKLFLPTFFKSLLHLQQFPEPVRRHMLLPKVEELIIYIVQVKGRGYLNFLREPLKKWHAEFAEVIQKYRLQRRSISELAELTNMSPSSFKRRFKQQFQQSPANWFLEQRMAHAEFLLREKSLRPSDIFEQAGYQSLSTFTQAFKSFYGQPPKQYLGK